MIKNKPITKSQRAEVNKLFKQGFKRKEIASKMGLRYNVIVVAINKNKPKKLKEKKEDSDSIEGSGFELYV